jgi:hypothetical protein
LNIDVDLIITEEPFIQRGNRNKGLISQLTNFGQLLACCRRACPEIIKVNVKKWKAKLNIGADKSISVLKAKELFPGINLLRTPRCKTESHDFAEAALLAYYAREFCR